MTIFDTKAKNDKGANRTIRSD